MSNQTYANSRDPYWLSSSGVAAVQFNKLGAPPLAYLNRGILYELNDGVLYFNGQPIVTGVIGPADELATTGSPVNVGDSVPPITGQILLADDATHATWQDPVFYDDQFLVVNAADPTRQVKFDLSGAGSSTTTFHVPSLIDREIFVPNDDTNLVGCNVIVADKDIPVFSGANPAAIVSSGIKASLFNTGSTAISAVVPTVSGVSQYSTVIGRDILPASLTNLSQSMVIGSRMAPFVGSLNRSMLIGNTILYQGAVGVDVNAQMIIGDTWGASGDYAGGNAIGNISVGFANGFFISTGDANTIIGHNCAVTMTTGSHNTLAGMNAGNNLTTGSDNVFIGSRAGINTSTGSNDIYIGKNVGLVNESDTIRIGGTQTSNFQAGIRGVTTGVADAIPILIDSNGQLGTVSSLRELKTDIEELTDHESEQIYKLEPVEFRYKSQVKKALKAGFSREQVKLGKKQLGLIADDVEQIYPDLCIYDAEGKLLTVDYSRLSILLLKEVQKLRADLDKLKLAQ